MTAKEQLRERVEKLTEDEAERTLRLLDDLDDDPVIAAFRDAAEDDEPLTLAEERAIEQARAEHRHGESVALDDIRHEFS